MSDTADGILRTSREDALKTKYDNGHTFDTIRDHAVMTHPRVVLSSSGLSSYTGPLNPGYASPGFDSLDNIMKRFPAYSDLNLNAMGARAIQETIPTKSIAGLSQFVGEMKEGLPSMLLASVWKKRNYKPSTRKPGSDKITSNDVGGEYLNYQFGIKPLISDITSLAKAVLESTKYIEALTRNSGKPVYGRFTFPTDISNEDIRENLTPGYALNGRLPAINFDSPRWSELFVRGSHDRPQPLRSTRTITRRAWFKGSYVFHLADEDNLLSKAKAFEQLANKLLGSRITMETIWELTPWSWLIDWYADIGTVMSNNASFQNDGLVLRYGYLMSNTRWDLHTHYPNPGFLSLGPGEAISTHLWRERKQRVRSTPYGFGIEPGSLTEKQWSILGALGMTKSPTSLRQ